jgi:tRNA(His) guanylyltransferase
MSQKLKDRIDSYMGASDHKILNRLPLIICVNGRAFSKLTSLINKPYCTKFAEGMLSATLKLCMEVEGSLFGYQHNDEILIISRNDQSLETEPWYDNKVQKICSITSSIATTHFQKYMDSKDLNLMGDPLFTSQVFAVPNIGEAINTLVYKQQQNFYTSIQFACFYELLKKHDRNTIKEMLSGLAVDEKINLLHQECGVDFNEYPHSFRRGAACYKVPKISTSGTMKNKWTINSEPPIFTKDQSFLSNIFKNGADIFREASL